MGKVIIGIVGLIIGFIGGAIFDGSLIGGTAAGIGIARGASAGICMTVQATEDKGPLTRQEIDQSLTQTAANAAAIFDTDAPGEVVGGEDNCAKVL
ncbi:hypothetical protein [Ruegeria sp. HKCCA5763]|uniref:hypothetical protein n=1 Tax=Ruegeria sp. HKCCA5763 TaxID=2682987 RepID=UPI00148929EC|nr:hypothetical protein [Ruegeria sp. HKCCA5763]